jgi:hypothetical protein
MNVRSSRFGYRELKEEVIDPAAQGDDKPRAKHAENAT